MSVRLLGKAFYADLPSHLKLLLIALCDEANDQGQGIFIGQEHLGRKISADERTVRRNLEQLRKRGWLVRLSTKHPIYHTDQHEIAIKMFNDQPDILSGPQNPPDTDDQDDRTPMTGTTGHPRPPTHEVPVRTTPVSKELAPRKRDAIWDVMVEIYGTPTNDAFRGKVVKVLRDYGADPNEIRQFVTTMAGTDRDWAVTTPSALAKHFGERFALMAQVTNPRKKRVSQAEELMRQAMEG